MNVNDRSPAVAETDAAAPGDTGLVSGALTEPLSTKPLGGGVQPSIADSGQCDPQSGQCLSPAWPANLHPRTFDLVQRFAVALAKKLRLAEEKYGFGDGWAGDHWEQDCRLHLYSHLEKGDPRDVAAYCAFMWHHGWITTADSPWKDIETAPHNTPVLLGWRDWSGGHWCAEVGAASTGKRYDNGYSDLSRHGRATHWMPLPLPPSPRGTSATATETDGGEG